MSPLFTSSAKLLLVDGKLATNSNCCCEGFCCFCTVILSYVTISSSTGQQIDNKKLAGQLPENWRGDGITTWSCFDDPDSNTRTCFTPNIGCVKYDYAITNDPPIFPDIVNGDSDDQGLTTDWQELARFSSCTRTTKEECERCRDPGSDLPNSALFLNDFCGNFLGNPPNKRCTSTLGWPQVCIEDIPEEPPPEEPPPEEPPPEENPLP